MSELGGLAMAMARDEVLRWAVFFGRSVQGVVKGCRPNHGHKGVFSGSVPISVSDQHCCNSVKRQHV